MPEKNLLVLQNAPAHGIPVARSAQTRLISNGGSHPLEARVETLFQILDVFEAGGNAQGLVGRGPACGNLSAGGFYLFGS
ncbi:MAG: hypothetical protein M3Z96_13985 [Pseudomonadota bacterium]|nr:hypothetical protein [Pseudomonadota bacterium]